MNVTQRTAGDHAFTRETREEHSACMGSLRGGRTRFRPFHSSLQIVTLPVARHHGSLLLQGAIDDTPSATVDRRHSPAQFLGAHGRGLRAGGGPLRQALPTLAGPARRRAGPPVPALPGAGAEGELEPL